MAPSRSIAAQAISGKSRFRNLFSGLKLILPILRLRILAQIGWAPMYGHPIEALEHRIPGLSRRVANVFTAAAAQNWSPQIGVLRWGDSYHFVWSENQPITFPMAISVHALADRLALFFDRPARQSRSGNRGVACRNLWPVALVLTGPVAEPAPPTLITFRPEFEPPWVGQPHVTSLTLNRLTRLEVEGLIDSVAGNKPMPANIRQEIIERTDGIPLFAAALRFQWWAKRCAGFIRTDTA
jgi:hypothetical protein